MEVSLLDHQYKALTSCHKFTAIIAGVGAGKTYTGGHWCIKKSVEYPDSLGFIGANSYDQLLNSTLGGAFKVFEECGVDYNYKMNRGDLIVNGKRFLCKSLENYDLLRGIEIGEFWLDETAYSKYEAWLMLIGRLRDSRGALDGLVTTTPKGHGWLYDHFHPAGDKYTPEFKFYNAKSTSNHHLPDSYIKSLYAQYDEKMAKQELEGEFINMTSGRIYYAFDMERNVKDLSDMKIESQTLNYPIWVGLDFNVDPLCGAVGYVINNTLYIFDEVYLRDSNTPQARDHIHDKYGRCRITPDSTADRRTTNSFDTDIQLLQQRHEVMQVRNPARIDRYNCMNGLLEKSRIIIDKSCKMLIKDLERVTYKPGSNFPDTTDKMLTHISDALGYLAWYHFPLIQNRKSRTVIL